MKRLTIILIFISCNLYGQRNIAYHSLEATYIGLNVLDVVTTYQVIEAGGYEANPAMAKLIDNKAAFITVKTASVITFLGGCRIIKKEKPKLAFALLLAGNIGYTFIVTHNYQLTLKLKM